MASVVAAAARSADAYAKDAIGGVGILAAAVSGLSSSPAFRKHGVPALWVSIKIEVAVYAVFFSTTLPLRAIAAYGPELLAAPAGFLLRAAWAALSLVPAAVTLAMRYGLYSFDPLFEAALGEVDPRLGGALREQKPRSVFARASSALGGAFILLTVSSLSTVLFGPAGPLVTALVLGLFQSGTNFLRRWRYVAVLSAVSVLPTVGPMAISLASSAAWGRAIVRECMFYALERDKRLRLAVSAHHAELSGFGLPLALLSSVPFGGCAVWFIGVASAPRLLVHIQRASRTGPGGTEEARPPAASPHPLGGREEGEDPPGA